MPVIMCTTQLLRYLSSGITAGQLYVELEEQPISTTARSKLSVNLNWHMNCPSTTHYRQHAIKPKLSILCSHAELTVAASE
jgi:hypothetical protein